MYRTALHALAVKKLTLVPYFQQEEVEVAYFLHLGQDAHQDNKLGTLWLIVKLI